MNVPAKPPLKYADLSRIHQQRQCSVIATLLQECPAPLPKHCLQLLRHAPESFDDLRYGAIAAAAFSLHLDHRPISVLSVQEQLARNLTRPNLSEFFSFLSLLPSVLPLGLFELECETLWTAYVFRQEASLFEEAAQALIADPARGDLIVANVRRCLDDLKHNTDGLPEIIDSRQLLESDLPLPPLLIEGLLHKGSKLSLGGGSKTFKSWTFLQMALALATGTDWLGFKTTRSKVLIVNFEIAETWMRHRLEIVCSAANLHPEPGYLDLWNLRGFSAPHGSVIPRIIARAQSLGYGSIIIDPAYKLIGQGDENSASDVGAMMTSFESITVQTAAAVLFGSHFAKGNAAAKEHIDRISGSGVFARDPDSILTFTPHEQPDCYTVEATLRNLPPFPPFVVQWTFPSFQRQPELDPANLRKAPGRPQTSSPDEILSLLIPTPLSSTDWQLAAAHQLGLSKASFYRLKRTLVQNNQVLLSKITDSWTPVSPKTTTSPIPLVS